AILEIQLRRIRGLLEARELTLELTPEAREVLCDAGYDPAFGARPLKHALTAKLLDPLSSRIIEGQYDKGDMVVVGAEGGTLTFTRSAGSRAENQRQAADA
ncbi:MAG: ATP-dependent chaperone ClpB, partial [Myxococcota bacterium]